MGGTGILFCKDQNNILLIHRNVNDTWGISGGALDLCETLEKAAKREMYEPF